jgi:copper(I)-binding protein
MPSRVLLPALCLVAAAALAAIAPAQVQAAAPAGQSQQLPRVEGAWVRSAVPGQHGTGAFMKIIAPRPMQLVGVSTPVAGVAEVHEMKMEGDVMKMRAIPALELPAGRTVELKPGGYHLMLMELKQSLKAGATVPITLLLRDAAGAESRLELKVPVAAKAPGGGGHMDSHKH